jgi:MFS family permease
MLPAIARVFKFYPKMIPLLPSIGLVGISIAFYASSLHKILEMAMPPNSERGYVSMRTGIMFLVLGFGEIIGGYSAGDLSDKIGVQKVGTIALASYTLAVTTSLLAVTYHETVVPVMFAAFFWGFQEAFIQNWITVVCSRTYKGALEAFVINKQFHSLTMCLYELMLIVWYPPMEIIIPVLIFLVVPSVIAIPFIEEGDAPPVPIFEDKVLPIAYSEPHLR